MSTLSTVAEQPTDRRLPPDPVLVKIRDLIYKVCGIYMPDNKFYFLNDRCARRTKVVDTTSLREYYEMLTAGPDRDAEIRNLLNEITVGETCFFRNPQQLAALRKTVIPKIMAAKSALSFTRLKFWSAGCSTGEEPYTLAMLFLEDSPTLLKGWTWEIIATDLNDRSVAKAKEGLYDNYALRNTPLPFQQKYFKDRGGDFAISDEVKKRVSFSRLNLLDESKLLFMKGIDVIFCANVLIYFDGASKRRTVHHFFNSLLPGGYFFLGHSESLFGVTDEFRLVHFPGATAYLRPAPNAPAGGVK
ncbi:MAG TPA: CheR family methyltransferase [Candidatus Sulfotelmatobacter sp.]|nr:CheR family methyltransferase [Candidatus Sulfotelmatobacter sp.]